MLEATTKATNHPDLLNLVTRPHMVNNPAGMVLLTEVKLLPLPEEEFQKGAVKELGVFDDLRVRILPVIGAFSLHCPCPCHNPRLRHSYLLPLVGPLPSIFGLHAATYILCDIAGQPIPNPLPIKNRRKLYDRLLRGLLNRERKITGVDIK